MRPVTASELGASWRPGCPVGPETLRRVEVDYVGFDGQTHRGELIVHQDLVADVVAIFEQLHRLRYPITKMRTVDHYPGADDELSMEDNNSSAFNCRPMPSGRSWSLHAFGRAVDLNPLLNPFIDSRGAFQPSNAAQYLDRRAHRPSDATSAATRDQRLHRSWMALGRRLANTEGLSAFRAPVGRGDSPLHDPRESSSAASCAATESGTEIAVRGTG